VNKEEMISTAGATGESALANMHLTRAHSKNGGGTKTPQYLTKEDILNVQVRGPLEKMYRKDWRVEIRGVSKYLVASAEHLLKYSFFHVYSYAFLIVFLPF
jgi:hypothetical protein